jgi:LAO/AO transport system kinase
VLYPRAGTAHLVGVTGAPGSGKSTLVAALVGEARKTGRAVAVVAIDPSSPITGGAILGETDRSQPVWTVTYLTEGEVASNLVDVVTAWS